MEKRNNLWRYAHRLIGLVLVLCMALCALPAYATDAATDAPAAEAQPTTVTIVVACKNIPEGTYITADYVELKQVPAYNIPPNVMTDINEVVAKYAAQNIYEGEYVAAEQVSKKRVNKVNADAQHEVIAESKNDYVLVTDYILPNTGKDLAALLQNIIDENPKRTIYFPDGEYMISATLKTSAAGNTSSSIQLADGAVIKATNNWKKIDGYNSLISLGGKTPANNISVVGSYYSIMGGTLDGNGKADGVSIDSGRESLIRNLCIVNCEKGIYVAKGANNVSSDCDFEDITIIGNGKMNTYGMYFIGYDNSITNIRIHNVETGIYSKGAGNLFKNIQVYNDPNVCRYPANTIGFDDDRADNNNWYSQCKALNCAVAFDLGNRSIISDCSAEWNSEVWTEQTAIRMHSPMTPIGGFKAEFYGKEATTAFLKLSGSGRYLIVEGCMFDESLCDDKAYENYLVTPIIPVK